jgi:hypothetical protein
MPSPSWPFCRLYSIKGFPQRKSVLLIYHVHFHNQHRIFSHLRETFSALSWDLNDRRGILRLGNHLVWKTDGKAAKLCIVMTFANC